VLDYFERDNYQFPMHHPICGLIEMHHHLYEDVCSDLLAELWRGRRFVWLNNTRFDVADPAALFVTLCAHLCISGPDVSWGWLLDLVNLSRTLDAQDQRRIVGLSQTLGLQLFTILPAELSADLWQIPLLAADALEDLRRALKAPERWALARRPRGDGSSASISGDHLRLCRRLAGRPRRSDRAFFRPLLSHPGVVCIEQGVKSDDPLFLWHRARHAANRVQRLLRGGSR